MKKTFRLFVALLLVLTFTGCTSKPADEDKTIRVGVNPVPHAEILNNVVKGVLKEKGWDLEVVVFSDYVYPNTSLEDGELDANYFQTLGYMNNQNEERGLHLVAVKGVHIEPMGLYSQKYTSIEAIPDGAEIAIPNDTDNGARAIQFLVSKGLLKETELGDSTWTKVYRDNAEINPHGYIITELEAAQLPLNLVDVDAAVINGNYALGADLPSKYPALTIETFDAETSVRRTNFIVVKAGNENSEKIKALIEAVTSPEVQKYIEDTYKGAVITSFIDPQN